MPHSRIIPRRTPVLVTSMMVAGSLRTIDGIVVRSYAGPYGDRTYVVMCKWGANHTRLVKAPGDYVRVA